MKARFAVSHEAKSRFVRRGLRTYFEYRDLGIKRATRGKVIAGTLELIEIVAPANFRTVAMEKPAARKSPARRSRG